MDGCESEGGCWGCNIFWSWVLILTLPFILRGRFWARFGTVGIVELDWAGLGWVIVDLSRCRLKEEKKLPGGVDVMIKGFILLKYNSYIPIYPVKQRRLVVQKGVLQLRRQRHQKFSFLRGFLLRRFDWGYSLHACCVVCFFLFCVDRILPTLIVRSLPPPPPLTLSSSPGGTSISWALTSTA